MLISILKKASIYSVSMMLKLKKNAFLNKYRKYNGFEKGTITLAIFIVLLKVRGIEAEFMRFRTPQIVLSLVRRLLIL